MSNDFRSAGGDSYSRVIRLELGQYAAVTQLLCALKYRDAVALYARIAYTRKLCYRKDDRAMRAT